MTNQSASSFHVTPYSANGIIANTSTAHIRTQPLVASTTLIGDFPAGTTVSITGTVHLPTGQYQDWYQITFTGITNGATAMQTIIGYVVKQFVSEVPAASTPTSDSTKTSTAVVTGANAATTTTNTSTPDNTTPDATISTDVLLTVPWFSQLYPDPPHFEACGPTSVLELLHAYGFNKLKLLQDWVSQGFISSLANTTGSQTLINLAKAAGPLPLSIVTPAPSPSTLPTVLRNSLAKRVPAIVLVDYVKLKAAAPFSKTVYINTSASVVDHWWVVVGIDGDDFIVNDSLWKPGDNAGQGGFNLHVPGAVLQAAFHDDLLVLVPTNPLP